MFSGLLVAAASALSFVAPAAARPPSTTQPIVLGTSHAIQSKALGESRTINVVLPPGYAKANKRYPVIYLIDGGVDQDLLHVAGVAQLGSIWGQMDEAILEALFELYDLPVDHDVMPMTISWLGNSSVATVPTLLDLIRKGKLEGHSFQSGDVLLLASVGAGMHINAMAYRVP